MKTQKYFGTDGIRGRVGEYPINVEFILRVGWSVGKSISQSGFTQKVLIGKDTRISGYMIESALEAGLSAAGAEVHRLGVIPTAAIAYLTRALRADIGIVISASHNPYYDNGIKFFNKDGHKLSTEQEQKISYFIDQPIQMHSQTPIGKAYVIWDAQGRYIEFCKSSIPHQTNLSKLKIVLDCANGAAYHIAPYVLSELGAEVITLSNTPDGFNINEKSGACHPEQLRKAVLANKAHVGIALDGDADRILMIDHKGEILDGDEIIYIILKGLLNTKSFSGGVVGTQMSNMGLEHAIKNLGINFVRTEVGDQNIIHTLLQKDWQLGGEPSGHIIYFPVNTTGDGIIAGLQVLQTMYASGETLYQLKKGMKKFPQQIINLPYQGKKISLKNKTIQTTLIQAEKTLGEEGRVLLRYSGTEPILRIMTEGNNKLIVNQTAQKLADKIRFILKKK